ncbi:MAG: DUF1513 domain-containing protein [Oligoflexia bacterium]|nr:DUF1513 domain-containing protein [Oligoflexia bacterium]
MKRRDFIKSNLFFLSSGALGLSSCINSSHEFFIGWKSELYKFKVRDSVINFLGHDVESVELSSMSHDSLKLSTKHLLTIPKWGKNIDIVDLEQMKIIHTIKSEGNEEFMGHGVIDHKRKRIYVSAIELSNENYEIVGTGYIHEYDLNTYKLVRKFSSNGFQPHELALVGDDLLVLNPALDNQRKSKKPNISIINLETKKVVKSFIPEDTKLLYSHLVKIDNDNIFIINERAEGDDDNKILAIRYFKGQFAYVKGPNQIFSSGGLLSTDFGNNLVLATAPQDDKVFIWNKKDYSFVKSITMDNPKAISFDKKINGFVIGCSDGIYLLKERNLELTKLYKINFGESASSHGLVV